MAHEALLANSHVYDPQSGEWINEHFQRIAEVIHDLSPNLALLWIPQSERDDPSAPPYAVAHTNGQGEQYIFMYIQEHELDERVIAKILESNSDTLLERLDKMEAAKELLAHKEQTDKYEQMADMARSLWKSPLHYYRLNGKVLHL